ncbi:hypothetical protein T492DRAFT_172493 [Pavlovales sp. CCMP2436]|nr:hypothetical protein T492DRAFT_172493 [Pavlovales sp. CCMP2436]
MTTIKARAPCSIMLDSITETRSSRAQPLAASDAHGQAERYGDHLVHHAERREAHRHLKRARQLVEFVRGGHRTHEDGIVCEPPDCVGDHRKRDGERERSNGRRRGVVPAASVDAEDTHDHGRVGSEQPIDHAHAEHEGGDPREHAANRLGPAPQRRARRGSGARGARGARGSTIIAARHRWRKLRDSIVRA